MNNPLFRPPAEAGSVILQVDLGCPHNTCTFCGMYKGVRFRRRPWHEVQALVHEAAACHPDAERVFLADGNVMARPFGELVDLLDLLARAFPRLSRVSLYANGSSIAAKRDDELRTLRTKRLHTLYLGLESGDNAVLARCRKGETAEVMVEAGRRAQAAGLRLSVMVLLGLAGREGSQDHALKTAEALNRMQPRLLSTLRVIPIPGTELEQDWREGRFEMLTEAGIVAELRTLLGALQLRATVFRSDHTSNVLSLQGRLPSQQGQLLDQLDALLASGRLDDASPGKLSLWL